MSRKQRGKLSKLGQNHKKTKQEHNNKTGRKGKMWAKKHVQKENIRTDLQRIANEREKRRRERTQILLLPDEPQEQ